MSISVHDSKSAYGCLFCRTGNEKQLAELLQRDNPELQVIVAEKVRKRRQGKKLVCENITLFPGYLFFRADTAFDVHGFNKKQDVFCVLRSSEGKWQLCGEDEVFASKLFEMQGVIGLSSAYYEGDRIRIVEGMLKAYEGRILRVNKRAQTAQISIRLPGPNGREITAWLGFELIEKPGTADDETNSADKPSAEKGV